jgi:hypothetical protein
LWDDRYQSRDRATGVEVGIEFIVAWESIKVKHELQAACTEMWWRMELQSSDSPPSTSEVFHSLGFFAIT